MHHKQTRMGVLSPSSRRSNAWIPIDGPPCGARIQIHSQHDECRHQAVQRYFWKPGWLCTRSMKRACLRVWILSARRPTHERTYGALLREARALAARCFGGKYYEEQATVRKDASTCSRKFMRGSHRDSFLRTSHSPYRAPPRSFPGSVPAPM